MADPDLELGRMGEEWGERGRVGGVVLLALPCVLPSMIFSFLYPNQGGPLAPSLDPPLVLHCHATKTLSYL